MVGAERHAQAQSGGFAQVPGGFGMHAASGPPATKHVDPWMQSASGWQGNAHFPYCVLHLCVMHCESFWHASAVGPGTAIWPPGDGPAPGAGCRRGCG